jgi:hypothetical protein
MHAAYLRSTIVAATLFTVAGAQAQLTITRNNSALPLANAVLGGGTGIVINSASLEAPASIAGAMSSGIYVLGTGSPYGLTRGGIVLSTGDVLDYQSGPNANSGRTTDFVAAAGPVSNPILLAVNGNLPVFDASTLTINFTPDPGVQFIEFDVVFGSEEFPEYVGSLFIDAFALLVNGVNFAFQNGLPINVDHPDFRAVPGTELDGVIVLNPSLNPNFAVLTFRAPVTGGSVNVLQFSIGDTSDGILDSTAYISGLRAAAPPECAKPPQNMVLWVPFDDPLGASVANNTLNASADAVPGGAVNLGQPGKVGNGVCFDVGYLDVPGYTALYLDNDITMDAWVYYYPRLLGWRHTIIDMTQVFGTDWHGYWLFIDEGNGNRLTLVFHDTGGSMPVQQIVGPVVPATTWKHVAVSVDRNYLGVNGDVRVVFWLDGVGSALTVSGIQGGIGVTNGLRIGDDRDPATADNWFVGCIDEVEVFGRALSDDDIVPIYEALDAGKCKEFCLAEWNRAFYTETSIIVPLRVCNNTAIDQYYALGFFAATCPDGPNPSAPSPVGITVNPAAPIHVGHGDCTTLWLTIPRPSFVHVGDISCYTVCITNLDTNEVQCCNGSVKWASSRFVVDWPPATRADPAIGAVFDAGPIVVGPIDDNPLAMMTRVRVVDPDMSPDLSVVSLNGLPPGEPVEWFAKAKPGGVSEVPLSARFLVDDPAQVYRLVLEVDPDGDGVFDVVDSWALTAHLADPCAPAEDEDFEFHPPGTVCGIDGFKPWQNETDVCGEVSTEQASSGNRSLKIVGNVGGSGGQGDDTVLPVSGVESGVWTFRCMTFVPSDATGDGAIVLLNTYDDISPPQSSWYSAQVRFRAGSGLVQADIGGGVTPMIRGQWIEFRIEIDLANDTANYFYDGVQFVTNRHWTDGVVAGQHGPARFRAIDFYGGEPSTNGITAMYIDDITIITPCVHGGADCNKNGIDDALDIAKGASRDCYNAATGSGASADGIPDECQCIADWNRDGTVNSTDVSDFINAFFFDQTSGTSHGDINCDGVSNSTDVSDFINTWFAAQAGQLPFSSCAI